MRRVVISYYGVARRMPMFAYSAFVMYCRDIDVQLSRQVEKLIIKFDGHYWVNVSIVDADSLYSVWKSFALRNCHALQKAVLSIEKASNWNVGRPFRWDDCNSMSSKPTIKAYKQSCRLNGEKVLYLDCDDGVVLWVWLQHDFFGSSINILGGVVIYVFIYGSFSTVWNGFQCTSIFRSTLVPYYCERLWVAVSYCVSHVNILQIRRSLRRYKIEFVRQDVELHRTR